MPLIDLNELYDTLPPSPRLLGMDVGDKTVGLALSDTSLMVASPLETLRRKKFSHDIEVIKEIISKNEVSALVIGLPINMNGTEGPRCQSTRQFAANILKHIEIPISFWDERLSTSAVTRTLIEADVSRKKRKDLVDKLAATYILQGALEFIAQQRRNNS